MKRAIILLIFGLLLGSGWISFLRADVPQLINYQGKLTDGDGNLLEGNQSVAFALFTAAEGGASIWSEEHSEVAVSHGLFNVLLGSVQESTLGDVFQAHQDLYLEIAVNSVALSPRQRMTSAGYALQASLADDLSPQGMNKIYPLGSIYISAVPTDPAVLLEFGVWEPFGSGRVLVGYDAGDADFNVAEKTGGAKTRDLSHSHATQDHVLSEAEMPAHTHAGTTADAGSHDHGGVTSSAGSHTHSGSSNSAGSHGHSFRTAHHNVDDSSSQGYPANNRHNAFRTTDRSQRTENNNVIISTGAHSHTLSIDSGGSHSHTISAAGDHNHSFVTGSSGSGEAHNHGATDLAGNTQQDLMNPYITVYIWKRVE